MANIKKLTLKLKSGLLSELQSDTIFGHFAWRFKDYWGAEKLEEFLNNFINRNPVFTVSDGFFEKDGNIFFPKPLKLTPQKSSGQDKKERLINFLKQKESKSRKLITLKELNLFLKGKIEDFESSLENSEIKDFPRFEEDLRVSVEIDRETMSSKEGQLFSYYPKFLKDDTNIVIFVKVLNEKKWEDEKCEDIFYNLFEIGFGKKKSSGYGQFEIVNGFEEFNGFEIPNEPNGFYSLSHYLPSNEDKIKDSYYDINIKYGKLAEEKSGSQNPFKPALVLLRPGSCFVTDVQNEFYGRAVNEIIDYFPKAVHNGIAFTLDAVL